MLKQEQIGYWKPNGVLGFRITASMGSIILFTRKNEDKIVKKEKKKGYLFQDPPSVGARPCPPPR